MTRREYWNAELETMPWHEVERWQATQVAEAVATARARSALYARLYEQVPRELQVRTLGDLARLPFTYKDDVRSAQDAATDDRPLGDNQCVPTAKLVQTLCSSGTTGRPLYYGLTRHDVDVFADAIANTWFTAGLRPGDVVAHLVGLPMVAGGLPYADGFRRVGATLAWLGGFPTDRILREMRRLRCSVLLATTSFGLYLADQWETIGAETGLSSALTKVLCGGEPGLNQHEIRQRITRGLGIHELREVMGLGDVIPGMWAECEEHDGMHFNAQKHVAIELIDPATGEQLPWEQGVTGEIVYTTLTRQATPMLRYRSRDHALVVGVDCACGRTSPRIRCIGRTDDMLIYKGMNVFPTALRDLVVSRFAGRAEPVVRIWKERKDQVRFDDPIAMDVEATPALPPEAYRALADAIEHEVRGQLQVRVRVDVLAPGSIPRGTYKNALLAVREGA
jgi:phenylacetate-coenzyme A ligase PaaK-like adenylate-forming protein